ncbi:MAG: DUF262 domain-containing protein [Bacteroidales bacterium]
MGNNQIEAKVLKVKKILAKSLSIPDYQRPYRWKDENVRLLLQDVFDSWKNCKKSYRIGSVILHQENENILNIVDGQQRLTTILLILKQLKAKNELLSLCEKLEYNHTDSNNNIIENHKFIGKWIDENVSNEKDKFCEYLTDYCEFVEIIVDDLSEAFQMFDSQNGRGKELEAYNLLKAYHIRAMETEEQNTKIECDKRWEDAARFPKNEKEIQDILKQIFNEQLYRTRKWSNKEDAYQFSKKKIGKFKGITFDKKHSIEFPLQNHQLLQYVAKKYFDSIGLEAKGIKSRFVNGDSENINPFVSINQDIVNGKAFFDYIETYVEIYKRLFVNLETNELSEFKTFYKAFCRDYSGAYRTGDNYLREVYKSLIFLIFDKFGEVGVNKFYRIFYALIYRVRLEKMQVKYDSVAKYPRENNLFSTIEKAKCFLDLQQLEKQAKQEINCRKEVKEVVHFFINEDTVVKTEDSKIDLEKYKKEGSDGK